MIESTDLVQVQPQRVDLTNTNPEIIELHRRLADTKYLNLLRDMYFKECDEVEIEMCLETCRHLGLDPIARQIYFLKIRDKRLNRNVLTPVVGIDGLRVGAERTGLYGGQIAPEWCGPDGQWRDVWLEQGPPAAARVGIIRKDFDAPLIGIARYQSFVKTDRDGRPTGWWASSPDHMVAKCAEAQGLRRCFAQRLSGGYLVQDVDPYETAEQHAFRVSMADTKGLIAQMREAGTAADLVELGKAAAALPEGEEKNAARDAWAERSRQLAAPKKAKNNGRKRGRPPKKEPEPKPEPEPEQAAAPEPQPEHDYGPPPMTDKQIVDSQEAFGFGDETDNPKI
jgi:phage recombination protein Bet